MFIIWQRCCKGIYYPYIALFPETYPCSPFYYSEEDFELFEGMPIYYLALQMKEGLQETYETICNQLNDHPQIKQVSAYNRLEKFVDILLY